MTTSIMMTISIMMSIMINTSIMVSIRIVTLSTTQRKPNGWLALPSSTSPSPTRLSSSVSLSLSFDIFYQHLCDISLRWFTLNMIVIIPIILIDQHHQQQQKTTNAISAMHLRDCPNWRFLLSTSDIFKGSSFSEQSYSRVKFAKVTAANKLDFLWFFLKIFVQSLKL